MASYREATLDRVRRDIGTRDDALGVDGCSGFRSWRGHPMRVPPRRLLLRLMLVSVMAPATLGAQAGSELGAGAWVRVRVSPPDEWRQGSLVRADSLTLVLRESRAAEGDFLVTIPRARAHAIEVSRGRSGAGARATAGALVGAAVGATLGWALAASGDSPSVLFIGMPLFGISGGIAGGMMGWKSAPRRWEPAALPLRVGVPHGEVERPALAGTTAF